MFHFFRFVSAWFVILTTMAISEQPYPVIRTNGLFVNPNAPRTASTSISYFSENGEYRGEAGLEHASFDHFTVRRFTLYHHEQALTTIESPPVNGFYLANNGLIAGISASEAIGAPGEIIFYLPQGGVLHRCQTQAATGFAFSSQGQLFALNQASGLTLFYLDSLKQIDLPPCHGFALAPDGAFILTAHPGEISIWKQGARVQQIPTATPIVRKLAISADARYFAWISPQQLHVYQREPLRHLFTKSAPPKHSFTDLLFKANTVLAGLQFRTQTTRAGAAQGFNLSGELIYQQQSNDELPYLNRAPTPAFSQATPGDTIPYIFSPFDSAYPVGNTYEEYQAYGGAPYPHPGVDFLAAPFTPVFAVANGVVKAVTTISAYYHWRVAVGISGATQPIDGWLYAHLEPSTIAVHVGDSVIVGEYLGQLVPWPNDDFTHCHFVKIRQSGVIWTTDWAAIANPLAMIRPNTDPTPPIIYEIIPDVPFYFCQNETSHYLNPDSLTGKVDIIGRFGDFVGHPNWECTVYEICYFLINQAGDTLQESFQRTRFNHEIPNYTASPQFIYTLYKADDIFQNYGDYERRKYYHIITNDNGDDVINALDQQAALNTGLYPDGRYQLVVQVADAFGNRTGKTMPLRFRNGVSNLREPQTPRPDHTFDLEPNFPNPFNNRTQWTYHLQQAGVVTFQIFNVLGELLFTLQREHVQPGSFTFSWQGQDQAGRQAATGLYLVNMTLGDQMACARVLYLR